MKSNLLHYDETLSIMMIQVIQPIIYNFMKKYILINLLTNHQVNNLAKINRVVMPDFNNNQLIK